MIEVQEAIVPDILDPLEGEGETLEFSLAQIEYLRSEFERQRRWVGTLSAREKSAMDELDAISHSVSYRVGRFLTWPLRRLQKLFGRRKVRIHHFVEDEDEDCALTLTAFLHLIQTVDCGSELVVWA